MTQSAKDEAKFLDTRLDDETAAVLEKWNLAILGAALLHDADHIRQAIRWHYKIPMQLWIINLAVYVLPTVAEFLLKNKRTSSFLTVAANGIVTSAAFEGAPVQAHDGHLGRLELQLLQARQGRVARGSVHQGHRLDRLGAAARPARRGHPGVHDGDQKAQGIQAEPAGSGRGGLILWRGSAGRALPFDLGGDK